ncbi:MAG: energy-coupling factor transporter ATPase [Oscillospiraceae bacterium]|nr:energy-coupling factor transporter ATPase [Oscillospiraceae bacterium]
MQNENPYIQIEDLHFSYSREEEEGVEVLHGINLAVQRGSFVAVLGHNGSGKSTMAKLLNMILLPQNGKIIIDGKDITDPSMTEDEMYEIRRKVGMVFQNPDNQLVATVVEEDIAFGPENLGVPSAEIRRRVDDAMELLGISHLARHAPHKLSGGQKQRVAIAGIIAMRPECIIFDEATAMLDPQGRREVMTTMEMLNREHGITILHITHNMDEAALADRVVVMDGGHIRTCGTPREVFSQVALLQEIGLDVPQVTELLHELNLHGHAFPTGAITEEECAELIVGAWNS